ncbi:MAG: GNAT family N-acetyltransferase [Clostridia bacterium]|nr:GNAT family N-acetyltransferase [Clostridia bacterium]
MDKRVILLNGPSSSGKSTLAAALAERIRAKTGESFGVVSIDDFMKIAKDEVIYEDDVWEIAGDMIGAALRLLEGGSGVIIDHVITSPRIYGGLVSALERYGLLTVHVTCDPEVLKSREAARGDRRSGTADSSLEYLYPKDGYGMEIDTGVSSPAECAEAIFRRLVRERVSLRGMVRDDIGDYVRWFTTVTGWMDTDAPWERETASEEEERRAWTEYYDAVGDLPADAERRKYEIEYRGVHVGWVCSYFDLDYVPNPDMIPAVGIDIPEESARGFGVGTAALGMFIDELRRRGAGRVFTQTWSGNAAMLRTAGKLGFVPYAAAEGIREVDGKAYDALTLVLDM